MSMISPVQSHDPWRQSRGYQKSRIERMCWKGWKVPQNAPKSHQIQKIAGIGTNPQTAVGVSNLFTVLSACCQGGGRWKCRTWQWRTKLQGWKVQDLTKTDEKCRTSEVMHFDFYTVFQKKHVTTLLMISLQRFLTHVLLRVEVIDRYF